ncbi:hypothetical protein KJ766_01125, partial [Patescibacteria group bacterium]|nr:hypothetical protein [Patescibacteria group bacterium]
SDNAKSPAPDIDEIKNQKRLELYKDLNDELMIFANDNDLEIILCVPEANKNILVDSLHPDVKKRITHFVSKNLASLNIEQIVRILQENKG